MSDRWAALLPTTSGSYLGSLRLAEGIEICEQSDALWLRGDHWEVLDSQLRGLPSAERYWRLDDGQLVPVGCRVPTTLLPEAPWITLGEWLACKLPPTSGAGRRPDPVPLRLVRSSWPAEPSLLLLRWQAWHNYALTAPQVRLDRLSFALDVNGRVLVRGTPLPPLPGERFSEFDGIAVPIGWHWEPAVDAATVRELFLPAPSGTDPKAHRHNLALITSAGGAWEEVPLDALVRATRSAVRLSQEAMDERT